MVTSDSTAADLEPYKIPWVDANQLARGEGGAGVVRRLREVEHIRRKLQIAGLAGYVNNNPGGCAPLPPLRTALRLLSRVQNVSPEALDLILTHPYTGTWLSHSLRLVQLPDPPDDLWFHIAYLHSLAAAAAIRAGLRFKATIPVWDGKAVLPTLGMVEIPASSGYSLTTVRNTARGTRIGPPSESVSLPLNPSENGPGWTAIPRVVTRTGNGPRLEVRLDTVDPYRGIGDPRPPAPIAANDVMTWRRMLGKAWKMVVHYLPELADGFPAGFSSIVPQPATPRANYSASTAEGFGGAILELPNDPSTLAAMLVHEFHHTLLYSLMHVTALHKVDPVERLYTLWRDDPRPIDGVLHGVYSFFGVTAFWRAVAAKHVDDHRASFEFAYWRGGVWQALQALLADRMLTQNGRRFLTTVATRLEPWLAESVPAEIATSATAAADDHYAGWRLRYLPPAEDVVARLVKAWVSGVDGPIRQPADPAPASEPNGAWSGARTELMRRRFAEYTGDGAADITRSVPGATGADFAYVSRKLDKAARGYRAELGKDQTSPTAWAGLGLVLASRGPSVAANALLRCPELVRAVWCAIGAETGGFPEPEALAAWIAATTGWPSLKA